MKPEIITFSGQAQHGKDTALEMMRQKLESSGKNVLAIGYADHLKTILKRDYGWNGEKDEAGRYLLQQVGESKRQVEPNYWVDHVVHKVDEIINPVQITEVPSNIDIFLPIESMLDYVLIRDARYPNEITRWQDKGYQVHSIHVERLGFENDLTNEQRNHPSETALDGFLFAHCIKASQLEDVERGVHKILGNIQTLSYNNVSAKLKPQQKVTKNPAPHWRDM